MVAASLALWRIALCASMLAARASCQLRLSSHSNGVLGAPGALSASPTVSLPPFDPHAGAHSFSFTGTLTPPASEAGGGLVSFSATTAGALRVFVDDHLVLDAPPAAASDCARVLSGWAAWPPAAGAAPVPLRVEYAQLDAACAPALELLWQGNTTALAPVPASALGPPPVSGPRAEYMALRDRLYEPTVPWQTFYAPSMTGHALQPTGLVLLLSLTSTGGGYLGNVRVFPELAPAWVRTGGHSYNGSEYTAVHVSRWMLAADAKPLNASVSFFTTTATAAGGACNGTLGNGGLRCDLIAVAACEGGDCAQIQLVVTAMYAWAGSGGLVGNASVLTATPAGFAPTLVIAGTPPSPAAAAGAAALPTPALVLPFSARADLPWSGPGGGADMAVAVVSTGAPRSVGDAVALVAAARARYDAGAARYGAAANLYEPMRGILAWNTLFSQFTHVYTPVTRNWYTNPDQIGTFVWDVFFAAVMISTDADDARARDIACANLITTVFSRTWSGMVPNYASGESATYDRTEPAVGSWALRVLRDRFGADAAWLPELLFPALVAWHDWFHAQRRNVGVLAASGAGGLADAISLGSDATSPPGLNTPHTLAAARYESGLDNSPQYDGDDGQCSGPSCPCTFNASSSLMNVYDAAFTAYHIVDADELIVLAGPLNRSDVVPRLTDRSQRAAAVLNSALWSEADGSYTNVLIASGLPVPRWAPTVFSPMFAGVTPRSRLPAMLAMLGDPAVFCVNETHTGSGGSAGVMLVNIGAAGAPTALSCVSDACLVEAVLTNAGTGALLQAMVQPPAPPDASALLNLTLYATASGAHALTTPAFAPTAAGFEPLRVEAACYAAASPTAPVPLTLWSRPAAPPDLCSPQAGFDYVGDDIANTSASTAAACCAFCRATPGCVLWKWAPAHCYAKSGAAQPVACADCIVGSSAAAAPAYATCGTAACNASAAAAGLAPAARPMCWVAPVANPLDWPCAVPLPSIGRSDPAFGDQTYWRGRAWAPQTFLVWLGLQRYADDAGAAAARRTLVSMASRVFLRQLALFGQINENLDGLLGLGSDSTRADSYYHWSALWGFIGLVEAGGFPADVLVAPAPQ